jgi:OmcA/MtrC family decaheme c-type cytochrome
MKRLKNYGGALLLGGVLALAGCAGSDGAQGPQGPAGADGNTGPSGVNGVAGKLKLTINGVVTAPVNGTNTATLTFTVSPAANVCPGGTCNDTLSLLGQKTLYAQEYNTATKTFDTAKNFSFGSIHFKGYTADGTGAVYTAIKANPPFTVETSASAFVYGYIATPGVVPAPTTGHYSLPDAVSSAAKVYGTVAWTSNAVVSGCEKCHGAPYSKHGYRQAAVAGLPDFASCKACHTDQRSGSDWQWYAIADDPAQLAADPNGVNTAFRTRYTYTANVMNDTHNSHAMEFNYPQSMANCVTCHKGKLANILTDANFKPMVCKSCHPARAVAGVEGERAPAMHDIWAATNLTAHQNANLDPYYSVTLENACNVCHFAGNLQGAKTFAEIHKGYNEAIYKDGNGARFDASIVATVTSVSYDAAAYVATVSFSVSGVSTSTAVVVPTVVGSLYGYDTKDFLVTGHSSSPKIECAKIGVGACTAAMTVTQGADNASFVASINLSTWANLINAGQVKRMEVGILPAVGFDPNAAISTTTGNFAVGVTGAVQTVDLTSTKANAKIAAANVYGKKIVDAAKCNACHDELGTTFHAPNYGSATTVGCRLCHTPQSAASHLEVQSRSIDSYVHAIHAMQVLDGKNFPFGSYDPAVDPVSAVSVSRYNDHVEGNYPNFAGPLNCESCHNPGTYDPPDQTKSLPGFISVIAAPTGRTGLPSAAALPQQITGPGARACGGCHRAFAINEGDGAKLASFVSHTNDFSTYVTAAMDPGYSATNTAAYIQYMAGAAGPVAATIGAKVERCDICHATAGSDHQNLFNVWRNGTK